jgi:hypothetical protein
MTSFRILAVSLLCAVMVSPVLTAADLSKYRSFQIGSDLRTIVEQTRMDPSQGKVVHRRPALIQELEWRAQPLGPPTQPESVSKVVFSFYNGELYRMVVSYDRYKTEGLTAEDLIEAISATYGNASRTAAEIVLPSIYGNTETLKVLARWEDAEYSLNLVRFADEPGFTLVMFSKRLDTLAREAALEAIQLDVQEAPQRELDLKNSQEAAQRAKQEKARQANKPGFRP